MPDASPSLPAGLPPAITTLSALVALLPHGVVYYHPVYDDGGQVIDFRFAYLNSAAQRMLGVSQVPTRTYTEQFPASRTNGDLAFHLATYASDKPGHCELSYQIDGYDYSFRVEAQRVDELLLATLTDTTTPAHLPAEATLRETKTQAEQPPIAAAVVPSPTTEPSELNALKKELRLLKQELETREEQHMTEVQAAHAEAERERNVLQAVLAQAPVGIGVFQGEQQVVTAASDLLCAMWGYVPEQVIGQPLLVGVPELRGQGFTELMQEVARTGVPISGTEVPAELLVNGQVQTTYHNFVYQPFYDTDGKLLGVLNVSIDVTEQILVRQQLQAQERQTQLLNEELQAANEEIRANNDELTYTQIQLRQLNKDLEARVQTQMQDVLRAQSETEAQRQLLHDVLHQAPVAIAYLEGADYCIQIANPTVCELWARPESLLLGQPLLDALPELQGQGVDTLLDGVLHSGVPYEGTELPFRLLRHGQLETIYFNFVYQPQRTAQGQMNGVLVVAHDVTEQVRARQRLEAQERQTRQLNEELTTNNAKLEHTQAELRELNDQLETRVQERTQELAAATQRVTQEREGFYQILEQTPAAICILRGPEHRISYQNPTHIRMYGGRNSVGRPVVEGMADTEVHGYTAMLDTVYTTGETTYGYEVPYEVTEVEGGPASQAYFNSTFSAYRENGEIVGVSTFAYDVTEQVMARRQVQQLNENLQAINTELSLTNGQLTRTNVDLDNFIYSASHDLKAPISNIEGLLRLLREDLLPAAGQTDEDVTALLTRMQDAVERFKRTIEHLTDVSKLQLEFSRPAVSTDLAPVLEDVRQDLQPLLMESGGQLTVDVAACPTLVISEKNLRSILYNLISNALKYHYPDRVPRVHISCHTEGNRHVLRVQDNGLGLSEGQQAKLFGLFQRLHTHVEGTGVGLYMVKKMVENVGGVLSVESQVGEGSTFVASFPA
ncbi:PAS domain-containing protein [Hymenobacter sp. GOD-10R]|uniref:PAS domain-containing protein n=1 Tax=Hymenobacter sp. GOD-10R TaxID=3093922 RepID=UPI002D76A4CB|nr:PAS domain-containing protein [Hymenobacter sp. GOD-10R]WRQ26874.1 PAS domain-containing protein [Hymenobacter sp. GOD-10R]